MPGETPISQLVVEGKNDRHVVWALCKENDVAETFAVEIGSNENENGGVTELIEGIPVRLKISGLQALGIVADADQNPGARWDAISQHLTSAGYENLPRQPSVEGTIIEQVGLPRVGVWLMPNNQLIGNLENFAIYLVPENDLLFPKAEKILREIEFENLRLFTDVQKSKALIHTWLAWQESPGRPIGQSITAHILMHNAPIATLFVDWLNRLFTF